jgi:predicted DNA binding CopG/RHH family protein
MPYRKFQNPKTKFQTNSKNHRKKKANINALSAGEDLQLLESGASGEGVVVNTAINGQDAVQMVEFVLEKLG